MFKRGYDERKLWEYRTLVGANDPIPVLFALVERVAQKEGVTANQLLAKLIVANEEITTETIREDADYGQGVVDFDARGNHRGVRVSGR